MRPMAINIPKERIETLCLRYQVRELAVFGSVLRPDFDSTSDVDFLVTFEPDCKCDLFDLSDLAQELEGIFGRHVDLVEKAALKNPFRKKNIFNSMEIIYAA